MKKQQLTSYSVMKDLKVFPLRSGITQGCLLLSLRFNLTLEVLAKALRQEKINGIQIEKEDMKQSLLLDDMIIHLENTRGLTKKESSWN